MLAANAELEVRARSPPPLRRDRDQLADSLDIEGDERVAREDAFFDIGAEEAAGVVAAEAERGLGKIVGAEAEELRFPGDIGGRERGAGQFDHRSDEIIDRAALLLEDR